MVVKKFVKFYFSNKMAFFNLFTSNFLSGYCEIVKFLKIHYSRYPNAKHIQSPGIVRSKHFQRYLGIFRDIETYLSKLTGVQLREGREQASPAVLRKSEKCSDFTKKALTVSIFGLNLPCKHTKCSHLFV